MHENDIVLLISVYTLSLYNMFIHYVYIYSVDYLKIKVHVLQCWRFEANHAKDKQGL